MRERDRRKRAIEGERDNLSWREDSLGHIPDTNVHYIQGPGINAISKCVNDNIIDKPTHMATDTHSHT